MIFAVCEVSVIVRRR